VTTSLISETVTVPNVKQRTAKCAVTSASIRGDTRWMLAAPLIDGRGHHGGLCRRIEGVTCKADLAAMTPYPLPIR